MSKKASAAKNITTKIETPNPSNKPFAYRDNLFGGFVSWGPDFLDNLAVKLANWAWENRNNYKCKAENAVKLCDFYNALGIPYRTFYGWVEKNPNLKEARDYAVEAIGSHREKGGLWKRLDSRLIAMTMARYDREERKSFKWMEKVKAQARAAEEKKKEPIAFNINMVDYSKKPEPIKEEKKKNSKKS